MLRYFVMWKVWFQNRRAKWRKREHTKKGPGRPAHNAHPQTCSGEPIPPEELQRREEQRLAKKRRKQEERLRRLEERRSTNVVASHKESSATFSDVCSLSTSDCCESARNDSDNELSRTCHVDERCSDSARESPLYHPDWASRTTEVNADNDDEARKRCADGASTAADGAPCYSSFSIWNILQATTRSKRQQSSPGCETYQQQRCSLALFAGDDCGTWRDAGRPTRQLLMQAAVTQPLGFQVERLSTPPCVTAAAVL